MIKKLLFLALLFSVVSCNFRIEKRRYFKGYHVEIQKPINGIVHKNEATVSDETAITVSLIETTNYSKSSSLDEINSEQKTVELATTKSNGVTKNNAKKNLQQKKNFNKQNSESKKESELARKDKSNSDGYLFTLFSFIGLSMLALLQKFKFIALKISNWASKNKYKSLFIIGLLQVAYASLAIALGKTLHYSGYNFSNTSYYIFTGLSTLGFIAYFLKRISKKADVFKSILRKKLYFLGITLASVMMMIGIGNKVEEGNQSKSTLGYIVEKHHNKFIANQLKLNPKSTATELISAPNSSENSGLMAVYILLIVLTGVLIVVLACAILCMIALGSADPQTLVLLFAALIICIAGLVMSIIALTKLHKERKAENKNTDTNPTF